MGDSPQYIRSQNSPSPSRDYHKVEQENKKKVEKIPLCCSNWPTCSRGDECRYLHPQMPCLGFPNCPFASDCLLIHPEVDCPDGSKCRKVKCNYLHPESTPEEKNSRQAICRYHPKCTNRECPYVHPEVPLLPQLLASGTKPQNLTICKFGVLCTRGECYFYHPESKILPQTGGYPPTPCRHGAHCTVAGCTYLHDPILTAVLAKLQETGATSLAQIGVSVSSILPHLSASSAASLIPAVNPTLFNTSTLPTIASLNFSSMIPGLQMPTMQMPMISNQPMTNSDLPYLPSDDSPLRK